MSISGTKKPKAVRPATRMYGLCRPATRPGYGAKFFRGFGRTAPKFALCTLIACASLQFGCVVGPKYARPVIQSPTAYKELHQEDVQNDTGWKIAEPNDAVIRGKWWEAFNDSKLNELEEKAAASNQIIAAAAANFLAARSLVRQARSQYFPTITTNPSIMNSRPSSGQFGGLQTNSSSSSGVTVRSFTDYSLPFDASWEPDSLKQLLDSTVTAYSDALRLTRAQYRAGLSSDEAVAEAEAQLEAAQAQDNRSEEHTSEL